MTFAAATHASADHPPTYAEATFPMEFQPGLTVGIDLGTTFSAIAHLDEEGNPVVDAERGRRDRNAQFDLAGR